MKQAKFQGARTSFRFGKDDAEPTGKAQSDSQGPTVTYSEEAISELVYMIEEEKLAGDIYEAFYDLYDVKIFDNIAQSEDKHFDALIKQAEALGIDTDQFVFAEAGEFEDPELQEMYDTLLAQGSTSLTDALEVGVAIEEKDMVDIAAAMEEVAGTTLEGVYDNLLTGSAYHLDAFAMMLA
jgi:hypothetical protein